MSSELSRSSYVVKVSGCCNLRCQYCYYLGYSSRLSDLQMDLQLVEKLVEQASQRSACVELIWHGGEPLLAGIDTFERILEIQARVRGKRQVRFLNRMQTNATLIDNEWIELFSKGGFAIGVSLDGPQWIHDKSRTYMSGGGSYQDAMRGIQLLRDAGLNFSVLSVVTKHSLGYADEVFFFFCDNGFKRFDFLPCIETSAIDGEINGRELPAVTLNEGDFASFMVRIFDLWFESDDPSISIRYLEQMLTGLLGGHPSLCKFNGKCCDYVTIDYDGMVLPCDSFLGLDELEFGNLGRQSLEEILSSDGRKSFRNAVSTTRLECSRCEYFPACHGACSRYSYVNSGNFQSKNRLCEDRKRLFAHISSRLHEEHPLLLSGSGLSGVV